MPTEDMNAKPRLTIDRIDVGLYQGSQPNAAGYALLKQSNCDAILTVNLENPHLGAAIDTFGAENVLHVKWLDDMLPKRAEDFWRILDWYENLTARVPKANLFTHCHMGINRSTVATVWLLMTQRGLTMDQAYDLVHQHRPVAMGTQRAYKWSIEHAYRQWRIRRGEDVSGDGQVA